MLLDIIQDENKLHVSYWGEDGKTHIEVVDVPEKEQFVWLTEPKNKKDEKSKSVKNWNGLPVFKHKINIHKEKLNRYRMYEILDGVKQEIKDKIFG